MKITEVTLRVEPPSTETVRVSDEGVFKYAVLSGGRISALFAHKDYAERYVRYSKPEYPSVNYTIREVA